MRSHIVNTLIAVAVASTLTACASHRDTSADTAAADMPMTSMEQSTSTVQATPPIDHGVADTSQMATTTTPTVDSTAGTQMGATASGQAMASGQATASGQQDMRSAQAMPAPTPAVDSTMSGHTGMDAQISAAGAMKTEWVDSSQMGSSTGGATASSMDQQAVCGMYADLKSARSTAEREKIMTAMLLNVPRGDSALVDVSQQCGSAAP